MAGNDVELMTAIVGLAGPDEAAAVADVWYSMNWGQRGL